MAEPPEHDEVMKLLVMGSHGCGKSMFIQRYVDDDFTDEHVPTVGIDFKVKTVEIGGKKVKVQIWDTAGQDRFRTRTSAYYEGVHGVFILYDITDQESFNDVADWYEETEMSTRRNTTMALVACKCDQADSRCIELDTAKIFVEDKDMPVYEVSSKTDVGVQEAFSEIIDTTFKKMLIGMFAKPRANAKRRSNSSFCTIL